MLHRIENQIFRNAAPQAIRHLPRPNLKTSDPVARAVLAQAAVEFQVAPPLTIHMGDADLLAGVWHATREAYVVDAAHRPLREAVAWGVSKANECPYCVTVHAGMYESAGGAGDATRNQQAAIGAAFAWATQSQSPHVQPLAIAGLGQDEVIQALGTAALFHYINRLVSVFLAESPVALPGTTSKLGQKLVQRSFRLLGKRMASQDPQPGKAACAQNAPLPDAFHWAVKNRHVAAALAHFAESADAAGRQAVSHPVQEVVRGHLATWQGEPVPLSRAWLGDAVAPLSDQEKPLAKLLLLTARAAWQVEDATVAEARKVLADDTALLQAVAWASFAATSQIARNWCYDTATA